MPVDNAPHRSRTWEVAARFPGFATSQSSAPALSAARNAAVRAATGDPVTLLAALFERPPVKTAGFISPLTAVVTTSPGQSFPSPARSVLRGRVSPMTWAAYALQPASRPGT
jgi:hypothetical protein